VCNACGFTERAISRRCVASRASWTWAAVTGDDQPPVPASPDVSQGTALIRPAVVRSLVGRQNEGAPGAADETSVQTQIDSDGQSSSKRHSIVVNERLHVASRAT
jgi:hypothetical protein